MFVKDRHTTKLPTQSTVTCSYKKFTISGTVPDPNIEKHRNKNKNIITILSLI